MPDTLPTAPSRLRALLRPFLLAWRPGAPRARLRRWLLALASTCLVAYTLVLVGMWQWQERLLFHPVPLSVEHRFGMPADVTELSIDVPGAQLNALHLHLPHPDGVVLYLHGNSGNLDRWFVNTDFYRAMNVDLFMPDYRGFGKSSGQISSEAQLLDDVRRAWQSIAPRYAGRPLILLGRSLGTGLAAQLAASLPAAQRPALLVLVSPYRSMAALAAEQYPYVPAALLRYPLHTDQVLPTLAASQTTRIVLIHGEQDRLIPIQHSEMLAASAPGAELHRIAGAGHGDLLQFPAYTEAIRSAVLATTQPHAAAPVPRAQAAW
ncbi:MAG: alpha/beta hydrolase [Leptothrix sp. (in: b-proteobacteria)]